MSLRRRPRRRTVTGLAAAVVLIACAVLIGLAVSRPAPVSVRNVVIPVIDGPRNEDHVLIDATFFTPPGAGKVPAILLAHGFGQTKTATAPEARQLARAGFAVLTWSARGFGASTGQIGLDSPDYEVKDTEQLVSWLARQPRVLLDHPGDPRVGITGASYGGGIALLAAAYDHRIDAIVPQITWNNLATALFPNGPAAARPAASSPDSGPACCSPRGRWASARRRRLAAPVRLAALVRPDKPDGPGGGAPGPAGAIRARRPGPRSAGVSCPRSAPCTSRSRR